MLYQHSLTSAVSSCCWQPLQNYATVKHGGHVLWTFVLYILLVYSLLAIQLLYQVPEIYSVCGTLSASLMLYGLYCVAYNTPYTFYTLLVSVNLIRLYAMCSCYLLLIVTALVMRGEMREWWMVIVVLLLLNIWPATILLVPCSARVDCLGLLGVYVDMSVYCCIRHVVMKTNTPSWCVCVCVCVRGARVRWSPSISCSILI